MKKSDEGGAVNAELKTVHPSSFRVHPSPFIPHPSAFIPYVVWAVTATVVLVFVSLIVVAPLAHAHGYNSSAFVLYEMFGRVCHQIPERAFYIEGQPLAVCARCTGIYFGFAAGVFVYPLVRSLGRGDTPARKWLLLAAAPTLLDFALGFFGLLENTHLSRSLTGALMGAVAAFYVVPGLLDLSRMSFRRASVRESNGSAALPTVCE
jgi:uncharacterized membrane protein